MARWTPDRSATIAEYAAEVLQVFPAGRLVVGLDGVEAPWPGREPSGREAFARDLAAAFRDAGTPSVAVRLGDFPAADRLPADPERLYDVAAFRARVLGPFRRGEAFEAPGTGGPFTPGERAVLVVSGAFAHLGELPAIWHRSAWLQIPRAEARRRDRLRLPDAEDAPGAAGAAGWDDLVETAFRRVDARKRATATFDLADPEHPRRRFEDAC